MFNYMLHPISYLLAARLNIYCPVASGFFERLWLFSRKLFGASI